MKTRLGKIEPIRPARAGFALRDLLMVFMILLLLLAGGAVYLQNSREHTRLDHCTNNIRLLGLAIHNQHDVFRRLPSLSTVNNHLIAVPGDASVPLLTSSAVDATDVPAPAPSTQAGYSWLVKVLPYMECTNLNAQIYYHGKSFSLHSGTDAVRPHNVPPFSSNMIIFSQTAPPGGTLNSHFCTVQLDNLRCPSYSGAATSSLPAYQGFTAKDGQGKTLTGAAISNYAALSATEIACMGPNPPEPPNGMIVPIIDGSKTGVRFRDVYDGLSKTLMLAETREEICAAWYDGTVNWVVATAPPGAQANPQPARNQYQFLELPKGGHTAMSCGNSPNPNANGGGGAYLPTGVNGVPGPWVWGPSSEHKSGKVNHLVGDGSMTSFTPGTDPTVYVQLVTRAGREPFFLPSSP